MNDPMPVFVIKAKDYLAIRIIWEYYYACRAARLDDQALQVSSAIDEFAGWRDRNPDQMKFPDHKHVPATES